MPLASQISLHSSTEEMPYSLRVARILSILPMNHLFEMTVGFATFLNMGFSVYYTQSLKPKDCLNIIKDRKINFMISVPAFLRLMKTTLEAEIRNAPKFYQMMFKFNFILKIPP